MTPLNAPGPCAAGRDETWYHTITLPDGTSTPGIFDTRAAAQRISWPPELQGGRCLDIGTCDGFWAFEMERRGAAEVIAIDVDDPNQLDLVGDDRSNMEARRASAARRRRRFESTRQALGSRVQWLACSVYDLDSAIHGQFDVIFCGTLLIHLRDPCRALAQIREVCAGELVLVECVDAFFDLLTPWIPCARFEPAPQQWWRMNTAGLLGALRVVGFDVVWTSRRFVTPFGAGLQTHDSRRWRWLAAMQAAVTEWPRVSQVLGLVAAVGLACGTYDVAVRARPRLPSPLGLSSFGP